MPLDLDEKTREALQLLGATLKLALGDRDLNRGEGRELRQRLLEDRTLFQALEVLGDELGLRFVWTAQARLDAFATPSSPFAWTKQDLEDLAGVKDLHEFVAVVLGICAYFFPEGDLGGEPLRLEGSLSSLDEYIVDRMTQVKLRPDLAALEASLAREVVSFIDSWSERAQAAPGTGQRKSRFSALKKALRFLEERRYVLLRGTTDDELRVHPSERLRALTTILGEAPHFEQLIALLKNPDVVIAPPEFPSSSGGA